MEIKLPVALLTNKKVKGIFSLSLMLFWENLTWEGLRAAHRIVFHWYIRPREMD